MRVTNALLIVVALAVSSTSIRLGAAAQTSKSQRSKAPTQNSAPWVGTLRVHWGFSQQYIGYCDVILTLNENATIEAQVDGFRRVSAAGEVEEWVYHGTVPAAPNPNNAAIQPEIEGLRYSITYSAGLFLVPTAFKHEFAGRTYTAPQPNATCVATQPPIPWQQTADPNHLFGTNPQTSGEGTSAVGWDLHRSAVGMPQTPMVDFGLNTPSPVGCDYSLALDPKWKDWCLQLTQDSLKPVWDQLKSEFPQDCTYHGTATMAPQYPPPGSYITRVGGIAQCSNSGLNAAFEKRVQDLLFLKKLNGAFRSGTKPIEVYLRIDLSTI